jgi:hypothetical protein
MTEEELRAELRSMIGWQGDQKVTAKSLAAQWGLSQAYLSDVLNGRRGIADKLANAMGYEREVRFVRRAELMKEGKVEK